MRRAFLALVLLAIAAAAAWTVWRWNDASGGGADPWRAVPAQVAVIIEVPDAWAAWDRFTHTSLIWRDLEKQPGPHDIATLMAHVQQGLEKDPALRSAVTGSQVIIALMRNGSKGTGWVAMGAWRGEEHTDAICALLGVAANERSKINDGQVTMAWPTDQMPQYAIALRQGLWFMGSSPELVEEALMQQDADASIASDTLFAQARATLGEGADAHVLVHTARLNGLLMSIWEQERIEQLALPAGWLALDLNARPDEALLNGLLVPVAADPLLASLSAQGTGAWNIGRLLPASVVQWEVRHVSDAERQLAIASPADEASLGMEVLPNWAYGSVGTALACDSAGKPGRRWLVIGAGDPESARIELERPCALPPCDTTNHRGTRISRMNASEAYELLMGRHALLPQQAWWAILGDHVVMSDDVDAVRSSIDAWNDGNSLAEDERATACFQRMSDNAALTWWCDPARGGTLFREGLKNDSAFAAWLPVLAHFGAASVQLSPATHGMAHVSIALRHTASDSAIVMDAPSGTLWSCALAAPVRRTPDVVINHVNNTREVLVQDTLHRLHLISAAGKLLWSRALDGPIMGAVHQLDRFKNGKLQMLFNTATVCYMIDRNGKDIGGFPVTLRSKAAAPLSVFDYDNTREYRVLIPTEDNRIINFTGEGAATEGWAAPQLDAPAIASIYHVRIRNKDHLLAISGNGAMKLFDRKGNLRESVKTTLKNVDRVHAVIPGPDLSPTRVVWTDKSGALRETSLGGDERVVLDGTETILSAGDSDEDGIVEAVCVRNDSVFLRHGQSTITGLQVVSSTQALSIRLRDGGVRFTLASARTEEAWVFDEQGKSVTDEPLRGLLAPVLADLNRDGSLEAITLTRDHHVVALRLPAP
ncbi:MAG: hypothetical protein IPL52_12180 [Flavobacteriales bacterium]|nr:hypothetical protein [Flavobacteriales bacterium]